MKSETDEVAFHNFQARGGFLVSAGKNAGGVYHVAIRSRRNGQCQLLNPWPGRQIILREAGNPKDVPFQLDQNNGECIVFPALAEHEYFVAVKSA